MKSKKKSADVGKIRIGVIGLGYVGLPLAVEFGRQHETLGFDISARRIAELKSGRDETLEVEPAELAAAGKLRYSSNPADLRRCTFFVVTVPTHLSEAAKAAVEAVAKETADVDPRAELFAKAGS